LRREGFQVNRKHVQRLMREIGIQGHTSAKKRRTTNSEHSFPRYPNLVEQLEIVRASTGLGV
jgi:putative transposase